MKKVRIKVESRGGMGSPFTSRAMLPTTPLLPARAAPQPTAFMRSIRWAMLVLNAFLVLMGLVMVILGIKETQLIAGHFPEASRLPGLWWMGLMPLSIGFVGLVSTLVGQSKWYVIWVVYSVLTGTGGYIFFIVSGCFDAESYGVSMRIYGQCQQQKNTCKCLWAGGSLQHVVSVSSDFSCDTIRYSTTVYLLEVALMTLCLAAAIIGCFLACVLSCCTRCCMAQNDDDQTPLMPSSVQPCEALNKATTSNSSALCMSEFVPPSSARTHLTVPRVNGQTLL